jgi:hypothetical protein
LVVGIKQRAEGIYHLSFENRKGESGAFSIYQGLRAESISPEDRIQ